MKKSLLIIPCLLIMIFNAFSQKQNPNVIAQFEEKIGSGGTIGTCAQQSYGTNGMPDGYVFSGITPGVSGDA